jgi:hypothetical protein
MNSFKKIILAAVAILSIQVHAGELINRATNESIKFEVVKQDEKNTKLVIDGTNAGFPVKEVHLGYSDYIKGNLRDETDLLAGAFEYVFYVFYCDHTRQHCRHSSKGKPQALLTPVFNIPALVGLSVDIMALPVTGTNKLISTINANKDLKVFSKVIATDEAVIVTNRRFNRIKTIMLNSI